MNADLVWRRSVGAGSIGKSWSPAVRSVQLLVRVSQADLPPGSQHPGAAHSKTRQANRGHLTISVRAVGIRLSAFQPLDHAPLETRVAWVRDLFERIDVDGVEQRAIARWKEPTGHDVDRMESVTEWLRR